jgi:hypothetical protein
MLDPPETSTGLSSTIIGGNVIGVASNVNQHSLRVYEKAKNYKLFEFYWDPAKDVATALQNGLQPANNAGGIANGTPIGVTPTPAGSQPGNPSVPGGTAQPPLQGPSPNPQQ